MRLKSISAQALLELALCTPIVVLLALGTVASVQVAGARAGLEAATQAAGDAAARAPDPATAMSSAHERFQSIVADYPLRSAKLTLSMTGFERAGQITAASSARIDLGWARFLLLPSEITLRSEVVLTLETWRTHRLSR
jgi:Flp pilus assembly protein TadG